MKKIFYSQILFLLLILTITVTIGLSIWYYGLLKSVSYAEFINLVTETYNDSHLIPLFSKYFTYKRFEQNHTLLPVIIVLEIVILVFILLKYSLIITYLKEVFTEVDNIFEKVYQCIKQLTKFELVVLSLVWLLIIVSRIYLIDLYPFNIDEAESYFCFTNEGIFITSAYYPEPNNHVFYNLLCIPFNYLLNDPLLVMRTPNVIFNIILLLILFCYLLYKTNFSTAIIALILCGSSYGCTIYSVHGRGYMLLCVFAIVGIFSTIQWLETPKSKLYFMLLIITNALGTFTIPIYVLVLLGLGIYVVIYSIHYKKFNLQKSFLKIGIISLLATFVLYTPLILTSGYNALIGNKYVVTQTGGLYYFKHILPIASAEAIDFIIGANKGGYIFFTIFFLVLCISYFKSNNTLLKRFALLVTCISFVTICFFLKKQIFAAPRLFTHYSYFFYVLLSLMIVELVVYFKNEGLKKVFLTISVISIVTFSILSYNKIMPVFYSTDYLNEYRIQNAAREELYSYKYKKIFATNHAFILFTKRHNLLYPKNKVNLTLPHQNVDSNYDLIVLEDIEDFPKNVSPNKYKQLNTPFVGVLYIKK